MLVKWVGSIFFIAVNGRIKAPIFLNRENRNNQGNECFTIGPADKLEMLDQSINKGYSYCPLEDQVPLACLDELNQELDKMSIDSLGCLDEREEYA